MHIVLPYLGWSGGVGCQGFVKPSFALVSSYFGKSICLSEDFCTTVCLANNADPDQTAPWSSLIWVCIVCSNFTHMAKCSFYWITGTSKKIYRFKAFIIFIMDIFSSLLFNTLSIITSF